MRIGFIEAGTEDFRLARFFVLQDVRPAAECNFQDAGEIQFQGCGRIFGSPQFPVKGISCRQDDFLLFQGRDGLPAFGLMPVEVGQFDGYTVHQGPLLVGGGEDGCLNLKSCLLDGLDVVRIQHLVIHGAHSALPAYLLQPADGCGGIVLPGIQKDQAGGIVPGAADGGLVGVEGDELVSQDLVRQLIGFHNGAVEHGNNPRIPAGFQLFPEGGNGCSQSRVRGGQDITRPQFLESAVGNFDRLLDRGVIQGIAHGPVDGSVVHEDHHAVPRVPYVAFDGRVTILGGHPNPCGAVLVDVELFSCFEPAAPVGHYEAFLRLGSFLG